MKVEIRTIEANRVGKKMMNKLRQLTLPTGTMWQSFLNAREQNVGRVYVAKVDGKTVAWLLQRPLDNVEWEPEGTDDVKIYVAWRFRRRGIGATLLREANKASGKRMVVYPWDDTSHGFFSNTAPPLAIFCEDWSERGIDITKLTQDLQKFAKAQA